MDKNKKRARHTYSESFKKQVVLEYLQGASYQELVTKYELCNNYIVYNWRKAFEHELLGIMTPQRPKETSSHLQPENEAAYTQSLETQLERAQLTIKALEMLIEEAESTFAIQIKKKSGVKQYKK